MAHPMQTATSSCVQDDATEHVAAVLSRIKPQYLVQPPFPSFNSCLCVSPRGTPSPVIHIFIPCVWLRGLCLAGTRWHPSSQAPCLRSCHLLAAGCWLVCHLADSERTLTCFIFVCGAPSPIMLLLLFLCADVGCWRGLCLAGIRWHPSGQLSALMPSAGCWLVCHLADSLPAQTRAYKVKSWEDATDFLTQVGTRPGFRVLGLRVRLLAGCAWKQEPSGLLQSAPPVTCAVCCARHGGQVQWGCGMQGS